MFFIETALASATSADFIPCQKVAVKELKYCLKNEAMNSGISGTDNCWLKSKQSYDACVGKVKKGYDVKLQQRKKQKITEVKKLK